MNKTINSRTSTYGQGGKHSTSLYNDPFFKRYGGGESNGSDNGYHYNDYEDYSDED